MTQAKTIRIDNAERRRRMAIRHGLAQPTTSPEAVADQLVVLHATDPATIYLSVQARTSGVEVDDIDRAMFTERTMMRTLAMRQTLFVPTKANLTMVEASSSPDVAKKGRTTLTKALTTSDVAKPQRWLDDAFAEVLEAIDQSDIGVGERDGFSARDITKLVPRLATRIVLGGGKHTVESGATSRTLGLMAVEGLLARGRPSGAWTTRQYRWHRRDQWLPLEEELPTTEEASAQLLTRYLERFGPVTTDDCKWWTGWTATKTKKALAEMDLVEVELEDGAPAMVLAGDERPVGKVGPWIALLPSLDPTPMGWRDRDWYLGDYKEPLFDRNGNVGTTIWADGRIIGGWAQTAAGDVTTRLFETLTKAQQKRLNIEVDRLSSFLGDTIVKPSFPTPLQKELAAQ